MKNITIEEGLTFYSKPCNVITVLKRYNDQFYQVEDKHIITGDSRNDILLTPEAIQYELGNQEEIQEQIQKAIAYHAQQEIDKSKQEKEEAEEQLEFNNVFGYCDNMQPYQKGKILITLNKEIRHNNKYITRKEFIKTLLEQGYTLRILDTMLTSSKKTKQLERIENYKNNVPIIKKDNTFYEITKTEYNYGMYLIENILQTV